MKQTINSKNEFMNLERQVKELQDQIDILKKDKERVERINKKLNVNFIFQIVK